MLNISCFSQMIEIKDDVSGIDSVVENLLDEQSLQDEKILTLEQNSDSLAVNLVELQQDVQGTKHFWKKCFPCTDLFFSNPESNWKLGNDIFWICRAGRYNIYIGLGVTVLEENGGNDVNITSLEIWVSQTEVTTEEQSANITQLVIEIFDLESVTGEQEARITINQQNIEGMSLGAITFAARCPHRSLSKAKVIQQILKTNLKCKQRHDVFFSFDNS